MFLLLPNLHIHTRCSRELLDITCQLANALKRQGVKKGDRVVVYMPTSPYVVASMMACARIGAVHRFVHLSSCSFELDTVLLLCMLSTCSCLVSRERELSYIFGI